jgi:hypothetical protein
MRSIGLLVLATLTSIGCGSAFAQQIPAGTILPVMLTSTLDTHRSKSGDKVTGKIGQDVLLPDGFRIPKGSTVLGKVIAVVAPGRTLPARLVFSFTSVVVRQREIPIVTHLRALASLNQVFEATLPTNAIDDYGTSTSDWNTIQIGGAGVYRGNGQVVQGDTVVGRTTDYGAVTARLTAAPVGGCGSGSEREEPLWLFSPWACGVYGYPDLKIVRRGDGNPPGEIELASRYNIHIPGGSGWLLRTDAERSEQ